MQSQYTCSQWRAAFLIPKTHAWMVSQTSCTSNMWGNHRASCRLWWGDPVRLHCYRSGGEAMLGAGLAVRHLCSSCRSRPQGLSVAWGQKLREVGANYANYPNNACWKITSPFCHPLACKSLLRQQKNEYQNKILLSRRWGWLIVPSAFLNCLQINSHLNNSIFWARSSPGQLLGAKLNNAVSG